MKAFQLKLYILKYFQRKSIELTWITWRFPWDLLVTAISNVNWQTPTRSVVNVVSVNAKQRETLSFQVNVRLGTPDVLMELSR